MSTYSLNTHLSTQDQYFINSSALLIAKHGLNNVEIIFMFRNFSSSIQRNKKTKTTLPLSRNLIQYSLCLYAVWYPARQ